MFDLWGCWSIEPIVLCRAELFTQGKKRTHKHKQVVLGLGGRKNSVDAFSVVIPFAEKTHKQNPQKISVFKVAFHRCFFTLPGHIAKFNTANENLAWEKVDKSSAQSFRPCPYLPLAPKFPSTEKQLNFHLQCYHLQCLSFARLCACVCVCVCMYVCVCVCVFCPEVLKGKQLSFHLQCFHLQCFSFARLCVCVFCLEVLNGEH